MKGKPQKYCNEAQEFIFQNYKTITKTQMLVELKNRFGEEHTYGSIKEFYRSRDLRNGIDARFKKGHIPWSAGKKMPREFVEKNTGTFKKGTMPWNAKKVGDKSFIKACGDRTGYWFIKTAEPKEWKLLHRYNWEKEYGAIPEGYCLIFLDGDTNNCEVSNLRMVHRGDELKLNNMGFQNASVEQKNILIDVVQMDTKIKKANKRK